MGTLFDYIKWRGDLSFSEAPFNDVDSLIFSLISYINLKGIVPEWHDRDAVPIMSAANAYFAKNPNYKKISIGLIVPKEIVKLFRELKDTRRFRNVSMKAHVNVIDTASEIQFSATTFCLENGSNVIAYRGTDDTLVGWKEDFNMGFLTVVPAQLAAVEYLHQAAANCTGPLYLTGHSKGGNLSVYAAVHADPEVQERIVRVWNNDGPGFRKELLESDLYLKMRPRIRTFVPESAVVGMLLEHSETYFVVKSKQTGLLQHNGLNWGVMGGSFIRGEDVTKECKRIEKTLHEWINSMTEEQREMFIESIYQILSADNAMTLTDLVSAQNKWLVKSVGVDPHVRKTVLKVLSTLISINAKNIFGEILPPKSAEQDKLLIKTRK